MESDSASCDGCCDGLVDVILVRKGGSKDTLVMTRIAFARTNT